MHGMHGILPMRWQRTRPAASPGPVALEVGFNSGFSAALLLMACPRLRLTCVDIGEHGYTAPCFKSLAATFPGRVNLIIGDSRAVLPMHAFFPSRFDLIHIDGCHMPEVAALDVANCARMLAPGALAVMDDTDADFLRAVWTREATRHCLIDLDQPIPGTIPTIAHDIRRAADLAFYTVFCGLANDAADTVLRPPSARHPCFYYSNCASTLARAASRGWIAIDVSSECPPWDDEVMSASQAKPFKAAPHRRAELRRYAFTVYIDSKRTVSVSGVGTAIDKLVKNKHALLVKQHPSADVAVHQEFAHAMTLPRYASQRHKIVAYVGAMFELPGMSNALVNVWTTLVVRDMRHPRCEEIGETWMRHIERCGIECQISFFFVRQLFADSVVVDTTAGDHTRRRS
jgi:hypothetical protein